MTAPAAFGLPVGTRAGRDQTGPGGPPLLVVVYGPPGSGKSTLATALAGRLGLAHFDKDEFKDLLFERLGIADHPWSARVGADSWEILVLCTDHLLHAGVSLVIESNVRPSTPIVARLRHLAGVVPATVLGIYISASDEVLWGRFDRRRGVGAGHPAHARYERRGEFVAALAEAAEGPIDFGGPTCHLDTSTSWPDPGWVAGWITTRRQARRAPLDPGPLPQAHLPHAQ
jgi:predicted kinase